MPEHLPRIPALRARFDRRHQGHQGLSRAPTSRAVGVPGASVEADRDAQIDTLAVVETPEGIGLSLRPAGLVPRSMAFLLDLLIRGVIDTVIFTVASLVPHLGPGVALIGAFAVEWLYPVIFELTRSGATPGKRSLGLRVVMDTGLPVTPAASFTRNLLRTADFLPLAYGFGILTLLLNRDCKRLGDLAAGTLVVHDKAVALHDAPPQVEKSLAPARLLSMSEQAAIRSWAGRTKRLTPARHEELAKLALSVLPPKTAETQNRSPGERLLGVAQWLMGRREPGAGPASKEPPP